MNATISMDGLWAIIDSLSIKNKKWIAHKLNKTLASTKASGEEEILAGIVRSIKEAKSDNTCALETLWNQL